MGSPNAHMMANIIRTMARVLSVLEERVILLQEYQTWFPGQLPHPGVEVAYCCPTLCGGCVSLWDWAVQISQCWAYGSQIHTTSFKPHSARRRAGTASLLLRASSGGLESLPCITEQMSTQASRALCSHKAWVPLPSAVNGECHHRLSPSQQRVPL